MTVFQWTTKWAETGRIRSQAKPLTASTNEDAKSTVSGVLSPESLRPDQLLSAPVLFIADHQSAGKGRGTRTWTSAPGQGLLSSWCFRVRKHPQPIFSPLTGLALFQAASSVWPDPTWSLKAPNDLWWGPNKLGGLLIETVQTGEDILVIVGLGINVHSTPDAVENATALQDELARKNRAPLAESEWNRFLGAWTKNLTIALETAISTKDLSSSARQSLLSALNLHPNHASEKLVDVGPKGELIYSNRRVEWTAL